LDAGAGAAAENANTQFAVVAVGASQYKVTPGDVLIVDKVKDAVVGQEYTFGEVLLVGSQTRTVVGRPAIAGATVTADVEQQTHAKRIRIFKNRQRSTFQRTKGYRRQVTVFRIKDVSVQE
jgi:large subunit ribosomal protein L21